MNANKVESIESKKSILSMFYYTTLLKMIQ